MAGTVKANAVQLGDSATATQNFSLQTNVDGTAKLARGNVGATSQDILTIDSSGNIGLISNALTSYTTATTPLPSSGVSYSVAHSLGVVPTEAVLEFTCLTADLGYSVGDVVTVNAIWNGTTASTVTFFKNSTTVGVTVASGYQFYILHKSTGASTSPTLANWSYRFRLRKA